MGVAVDLDGVFGDTRPVWHAFLEHLAKRFDAIEPLDAASLSDDRTEAAKQLDAWAASGVGDWRVQLTRFAEDHVPLYIRPDARAMAAARSLVAAGVEVRVYTDAPQELADVAASQLGLTRLCHGCFGGIDPLAAAREPAYVRSAVELDALLSDN